MFFPRASRRSVTVFLLSALIASSTAAQARPDASELADRLRTASAVIDGELLRDPVGAGSDWLLHGRNFQEDRFSPLTEITRDNIGRLGLVWSLPLGTERGIEATPIVADGVMFLTGPWSVVYAVDARSGEIIWMYDPEVPKEFGERACCDVVNRGVALYRGRIYVGTLDGRLMALDAATGKEVWQKLTVDQSKAYTITGAPRVFDGKVVIGNGGGEYGVRGYVTAYDAETGDTLWRFHTVPGNPADGFENEAMAKAAETWSGEWWKFGGGGTCWDSMTYDPELELLYVGVGNGAPWNRVVRSPAGGDNLYLSSIVALRPDTGEMVWYYQTTPGDAWDFTATQSIVLADLEIDGAPRKVLMQAPKNGFFYVLDRATGELLSAKPFTYVNWATEVDMTTGRPIETEHARYEKANARIAPSQSGGHNWQPMAFNPRTGLVYIPARRTSSVRGQPASFEFNSDPRSWNTGDGYHPTHPLLDDEEAKESYGELLAWDPVAGEPRWSVRFPHVSSSGVLTTPDLVFQGTPDGFFRAYDAATGERLWEFNLGAGILASPVSYRIDGRQYVSIAVGWGGIDGLFNHSLTGTRRPGFVYTFALDGRESIPTLPPQEPRELVSLPFEGTPEALSRGAGLFYQNCVRCHAGGIVPDLTYSSAAIFGTFNEIVGQGALLGKGMPRFGDRMSDDEIDLIKNFLLSHAQQKREAATAGAGSSSP